MQVSSRNHYIHNCSHFQNVRIRSFRETIDIIILGFDPETIIIFGSVASGAADDHSDLDILVVMDTDESYYRRPVKVYKAVSKVCITKDILVLSSDVSSIMRMTTISPSHTRSSGQVN